MHAVSDLLKALIEKMAVLGEIKNQTGQETIIRTDTWNWSGYFYISKEI